MIAAEGFKIITQAANQVLAGFSRDEFLQYRKLLKRSVADTTDLNEEDSP